jgi:23S rRNA (guanosine2251-2'-O)-methyltransferase
MDKEDYIFGTRAVLEAVDAGKQIDKVMLNRDARNDLSKELLKVLKERKIFFQYVPIQKLNSITRKNHQGVIAFISPVLFSDIEEVITATFEAGKVPFIVVLDGVTDVRNFGAIVRTAECAGVHAVLVPEMNSAGIRGDAVKTSAGALFKVPVCRTNSLRKTLEAVKQAGLQIVSADEKAPDYYYQSNFTIPTALVLGDEEKGISGSILSLSDSTVKIPLLGEIKSLNVSVAASVLIYETVRQRLLNE